MCVWRRPAIKDNGDEYYEYIMAYVDDVVAISEKAVEILKEIQSGGVKFKNDKIEPPNMYLGAKLSTKLMDGVTRWTISSDNYVSAAVKNVEEVLKSKPKFKANRNQKTPMVGN